MSKKACIFDFDGTLVNTIADVAICFNKSLEKYGYNPHPVELYNNFVGGNLQTVVTNLLVHNQEKKYTEEDFDKIRKYYLDLYLRDKKINTKPYEGIVEVLKILQSDGIFLTINTNKKQILTEELTNIFFGDIKFERIIGYSENYPSKPDPTAIYDIMKSLNLKKEDMVYVGDGASDVKTAENAGIDSIFVTWGQGKEEDKLNKSVRYVINKPREIVNCVLGD